MDSRTRFRRHFLRHLKTVLEKVSHPVLGWTRLAVAIRCIMVLHHLGLATVPTSYSLMRLSLRYYHLALLLAILQRSGKRSKRDIADHPSSLLAIMRIHYSFSLFKYSAIWKASCGDCSARNLAWPTPSMNEISFSAVFLYTWPSKVIDMVRDCITPPPHRSVAEGRRELQGYVDHASQLLYRWMTSNHIYSN